MTLGRPTDYTPELALDICERIAAGAGLRRICKRSGMPDPSTVYRWLLHPERDDFREQYTRAREHQADTHADEIVHLSDTPKLGVSTSTKTTRIGDVEVSETTTKRGDMLGHRRLQVDSRKWIAAKLRPKKYGDRLELGGEVAHKVVLATPLREDEWVAAHAPT
jgi:hypothetical protein